MNIKVKIVNDSKSIASYALPPTRSNLNQQLYLMQKLYKTRNNVSHLTFTESNYANSQSSNDKNFDLNTSEFTSGYNIKLKEICLIGFILVLWIWCIIKFLHKIKILMSIHHIHYELERKNQIQNLSKKSMIPDLQRESVSLTRDKEKSEDSESVFEIKLDPFDREQLYRNKSLINDRQMSRNLSLMRKTHLSFKVKAIRKYRLTSI